ncbi:MAG TPA: TadE/TadG family type IV pilus assembly protein [Candidatus Binataceae bacterium]|nr:TadE/TadG family type IV pilus assembly protein [Candidatus Binataceae bacterium]
MRHEVGAKRRTAGAPRRSGAESREFLTTLWGRRFFKAGQAATEFGLVVPVLSLLLVGVADFARAFYFNQEVVAAARAGAQYGSQSVTTASDSTNISNAAKANGTNVPGMTVASSACTCQSPTPSGETACATSYCNGANSAANYVIVTTSANFTTLVKYPGIPYSTTMTGKAIMQVQD